MINLKNIVAICVVLLFVVSSSSVFAFSFDPPDGLTGAPNEGTCVQCHIGNTLNELNDALMLTVPQVYTPGEMYDIVVNLSRTGQSRWGFEMTALNDNSIRAGTFAIADGNTQVSEANSKQYIQHTAAGTAAGKSDNNQWTFKWTAPSTDVGEITFYAAGNAANGDSGSGNDFIYTNTATSEAATYGVTLAGVGTLSKTVSTGTRASYTVRVTNTGNDSDTIRLTPSGDASAILSPSFVSLAAGASRNVTLSVSGVSLISAGEYKVNVTATSQKDSSKTDTITTTTTVQPVYGVTLAGVGNITSETSDARNGVSYTLRVTNTGNTSDTFNLTTSGDTTATLSRTTIPLSAGASSVFSITIPGDSLTRAGTYNVNVTATSENDSSKTAAITTRTTILPVYDITLAGVGALTTETSDASEGITYTLNITNNGNTDDVIDLTTLGTTATLSQTSVSLAVGASTEVMLTISGDNLAAAGSYEVKVTATSQGDNTQTAEVTTTTTILPVYGITLAGVGALTTETSDASEGVSYTLNITNNGNTDDVIDLTTSGTTATLSQTSVSLAVGASAEVILSISGDVLATAGDYEVKISATSQGDNTKTAEVSTTTTILPVYDITLAGVGALTTETSDASEGVTYTLNITNNGNTDDVIDLVTSGTEVTLSQTEVSLAAGVSAEVMLTISGDNLAAAGSYEVKVTATSQGDNTKTAEVTTTTTVIPVYDVMLESVGALTGTTMDMVEGVTYTLTVTNNGNTDDTIVLGSSAEVGIGGAVLGSFSLPDSEEPATSQLEIMLAAGASAKVMFTAAGDLLTQPGEYEIVVTATSQGDRTKTASLTTTTTITVVPPEYGVMLESVGELEGATWNFLKGVTYTLTVTNTGDTDDTIILGSSAEVGIGGAVLGSFSLPDSEVPATSQLELILSAGESVEVMFTASGDLLTERGEYEITVTATSQGDSTKSAEVTTTTTIESVPWDLNDDGIINILDLVAVANQFGESGDNLSGDVNMDGIVNILDLVAVANNFGKTQAEIVQANQ
ncbi:MAG: hypothetical protein OXD54_03345 [Candidatus Poribacteria bacterium]|nr:hypothetical protein [Candidatus Poribacteria bacterium]